MKKVPLSAGKFAIVDDGDFERVSQYKWYHSQGYGRRNIQDKNGRTIGVILLHRFVMDAQPGQCVDHCNFNGLDCRRANMRLCTKRQNQQHSRKRRSMNGRAPTSSFKGVSLTKGGKWVARIHDATGRYLYLGAYATEIEAAEAYQLAARKHHGDFAQY